MLSLALKRYYSDSRYSPPRFRCLIRAPVWFPQLSLYRVSSTGLFVFRNMPTLLPREIPRTASVFQVRVFGLPHVSTGSASPLKFIEATCRFTCVTACCFANWKLTTPCYQDAAPLSYRGESDNFPDGTSTRKIKQLLLHTDTILQSQWFSIVPP